MIHIQSLGYLGLSVSDTGAWKRFATHVLGLDVSLETDAGLAYLRADKYHHRFILHPTGRDDLAYIGWEARDDVQMAELSDRLTSRGYKVSAGTAAEARERGVLEFIWLEDPLGLRHEIFYGPLKTAEEDVPPVLRRRFVTGALGLGHMALFVSNHDEYTKFYSQALGLRRASTRRLDTGSVEATSTWRCNSRHHAVALIGMRTQTAKRLNHFALHLTTIDEVGKALEKASEEDLVVISLGRHPSDGMLSFYMDTPSGFQVEYGWDGRLLDEDATVDQFMGKPSLWGHKPVKRTLSKDIDPLQMQVSMSKTERSS
jgi:2,3-dihydroxybiphenyl 1,2-dioxygenase